MNLDDYNSTIETDISEIRDFAEDAKQGSRDPSPNVEIGTAKDMAERCEIILEEELGELKGLAEAIRHYEHETDLSREDISFEISNKFINGELGHDSWEKNQRVEAAIRVAIALLTEGVVAAPIEGIGDVELGTNDDGTEFIRIHYNGPIRSAGGTGQALSVLVADHVRQKLGIDKFKPREKEVQRYKEEVKLYDEETGMQYCPSDHELETIIENLPLMLDGMATGRKDVIGYTGMERIPQDRARGGMALVVGEGIALKAPKIQRIVEDLDINWDWLSELSTATDDSDEKESSEDEPDTPDVIQDVSDPTTELINPTELEHPIFERHEKYLEKLPAGRPIYSGPSQRGGWRVKLGRARNTGLAASGFSPATMYVMNDMMAPGMQHKTERPGKAQGTSPVDTLEGATVRLTDGTVKTVNDVEEAKEVVDDVEEIIDVGEMLLNYGEFLENNHPLPPAPYNTSWWTQDLEHEGMNTDHIDPEQVDFETAISLSEKWGIPLHPDHTYLWRDISAEEYQKLSHAISLSRTTDDGQKRISKSVAETLEHLLVPHKQHEDHITLEPETYQKLNWFTDESLNTEQFNNGLECVNEAVHISIFPRVTLRIGTRMGRPEKSDTRVPDSKIHGQFPIDGKGGRLKDLREAAVDQTNANHSFDNKPNDYAGKGVLKLDLNNRHCPNCDTDTWLMDCELCGHRTNLISRCYNCGDKENPNKHDEDCDSCRKGKYKQSTKQYIDLNREYNNAIDNLNMHQSQVPVVKLPEELESISKTPEALEKPILRAKHEIHPFRDTTIRYDMIDLPLTSFKPEEIQLSVEQARELGYTEDIHGNELTEPDQLCEIFPQDVIISKEGISHTLQIANYVDELLEKYYETDSWYNADEPEDLIGEYIMGLAPHTSASVTGRIIGITNTKSQYAHPIWHAAKRRNCFAPDTQLTYKLNGEWNRSTIQELVENHLQPDSDGYDDNYADGSIVQHIDNHPEIEELKVPSMTDEGHRTVEPVEALSKHQPTDEMITIEFDDGTDITVTPDHPVATVSETDEKSITQKVSAETISEGEEIYDYNTSQLETVQNFSDIDLLEKLLTIDHNIDFDKVMIRGMDKEEVYNLLIPEIKPDWDGRFYKMKSSCEYLGIAKKTLDNYLRRQSIPISLFQELYKDHENTIQQVVNNIPHDVTLGMNSDNVSVPRMVTLDEELATLVGYYTAEGYTRQTKDSRGEDNTVGVNQVDFAGIEEDGRNFFKKVLQKKFNVERPFENDKRVTASGNILRFFFSHVLQSGDGAYEKTIPEIIQNSSRLIKGAYLSGYISGDGSGSQNTISMYTASEDLKDDLLEQFTELRFDSVSSNHVEAKLLREKFPDYYDEDNDKMGSDGYNITLNTQDSQQFTQEFGIHLTRKQNGWIRNSQTKTVSNVKVSDNDRNSYDITVGNTHRFEASEGLYANCDGDEDAIILMLDGLLNFSRTYLPDKIGTRSVAKDQTIVVEDDGEMKAPEISELVDSHMDDEGFTTRPDGFEVLRDFDADIQAVSFDDKTGEVDLAPVSALIRHRNDKDMYKISTSHGAIKVTENHSVFTTNGYEIIEATVSDLEDGDPIIVPSDIDLTSDTNIGETISVAEDIPELGAEQVEESDISEVITASEQFYRLAGYLGGSVIESGTMHVSDERVKQDIVSSLEDVFGVSVESRQSDTQLWKITIPQIVCTILESVGLVSKSNYIDVPSPVFRVSQDKRQEFVRGLARSTAQDKNHDTESIRVSTKEVATQLSILLRSVNYRTSIDDSNAPDHWSVEFTEWNDGDMYWPFEKMAPVGGQENGSVNTKRAVEEAYENGFSDLRPAAEGDLCVERIQSIEQIDYGDDYVYDLEVPEKQNFLTGPHPIFAHNTMDAPLVNTSVINYDEIDDEAYNMDVVPQYDRKFYIQTWDMPGPKDVDVEVLEDRLENPRGVKDTQPVTDINLGPYQSGYAKIEGMDAKVEAQLDLSKMTRAADETVAATKIIRKHFFPDLKGNLRAYAQQEFQCTGCYNKFRRAPLHGECPNCDDGGNITFTVHEGSVTKYLQNTLDIYEEYGTEEYLGQEIEEVKKEMDSIFEMDTQEQTGIDDFL